MSEIFAMHCRHAERLSLRNNLCFDSVSWPFDGHECPSYVRSILKRTQSLSHPEHALKSWCL
jgi:hypothetical protein